MEVINSAIQAVVAPALNLQLETDDPASFALNTRASGGALTENGTGLTLYEGYTITQATASQRFVAEINLADPDLTTTWSQGLNTLAPVYGYPDRHGGNTAYRISADSSFAMSRYGTGVIDIRADEFVYPSMWIRLVSGTVTGATSIFGVRTINAYDMRDVGTANLTVLSGEWQHVYARTPSFTTGATDQWGIEIAGTDIVVDVAETLVADVTGALDRFAYPGDLVFGAPPVALVSDGIDDYMQVLIASLVQPTTIIVRGEQITHTSGDTIYDSSSVVNGGRVYQDVASGDLRLIADGGGALPIRFSWAIGTPGVLVSVLDAANSLVQIGNTAPVTGTLGTNDMKGITLASNVGFSQPGNIRYFDVLLYNRALSAEEIDAVVPGISNYRAMRGMALGAGGSLLYTLEGVADSYVNGVPQSNRALLVDTTAAAVDHFVPPGFPITADGKLAVDLSAPVNHISNGIPYTADSKIAATITDLRAAILPVISP